MNASRLTILIAEDSATDRMLLATIVGRQGHRVLAASDGLEAVALFESQRPQLVLMDALMPVMDGFEAARRIKAMAGDAMVPIIFLTSLSEDEALVRCLEAGGDDFLAKPYSRVILEAKINAMDRLRRLHQEVLQQRDLIARHNEHLLNEQQVAKAVFDKVAHSGCLAAGNIRYMQSPYALFNGDLLLAAFHPSGDMHVLLGDFTGHGLPAAIGAMPLADVFYRMTGKGHSLAEILHESNAKLRRILPRGVFCCATVLNISFRRQVVEFWGGGLPDGYVLRKGGERVALVSRHLPLGVLEPDSFRDGYEAYPLELGDRVFLLSDGVLEAQNEHEELFGEQRLLDVLDNGHPPSALFDDIQRALQRFHGEARDDVSLVEVTMVEDSTVNRPPLTTGEWRAGPEQWSARFDFRGPTLRDFYPLPYLLQLLLEVPGLRGHGGNLYSVLCELYTNALEHGVLGLDSSLKRDAAGFSEYYRQRAERLDDLQDGCVSIAVDVSREEGGGRLTLTVEDNGKGFDPLAILARQHPAGGLSGRGMSLVRDLSERSSWSADGRRVTVEFSWPAEA
ncbi:DNA-binding response OmpR family regulator/signal transduction histidine kinase [Pseudomonas sp. BIGb0408]|uniref:DNA-binding response OmpR family regulator/signal transduction histidine kinase n=1 Tax=Phytopseudomonas flavescens TaxID=29435 RepID=A0A7Y9XN80_9GAMM|nr:MULTISPECIES: fused response regulator/phosphatase [Pseudomonas]MCW2292063.1 DNA-binding response OmpR family regulator/signal transduction histidine kinase [Pseudomonas sp. BIGb0408]NYH73366.1 DNA-binding response OmpR family regulator/signal transduction histidine kinase [Pseudomonas flavescens]